MEGLVLGQVRRLLASPELVARTITAVRREDSAAADTDLEEGDVIEALGALEVFPTSGYANPTLTLVALAIRLADHLKAHLARSSASRSLERAGAGGPATATSPTTHPRRA